MTNTIETRRLTALSRGSWKWQDAFRVTVYRPHRNLRGVWVWAVHRHVTTKASLLQLRRLGHRYPLGGINWQPLGEMELFALLCAQRGHEFGDPQSPGDIYTVPDPSKGDHQ